MIWPRRGRGRDRDAELDEEIRTHLEMAERDRVARGETPVDAERAARREFGNVGLVKEVTRESWSGAAVERWAGEVRHVLRGLARRPGVTLTVIIILALGIGANAAVFTITDRLLLRDPAGVPQPHAVRRIYSASSKRKEYVRGRFSAPEVRAIHDALAPVADAGSYLGPINARGALAGTPASPIHESYVTPGFFPALESRASVGRLFTDEENRFAAPTSVAVLSFDFWQRELSGDESVIGRMLLVDGQPFTIVGVGPKDFGGIDVEPTDVWLPLASSTRFVMKRERWYESAGLLAYQMVVRAHPDISESQIAARTSAALRDVARAHRIGDTASTAVFGPLIAGRGPQGTSQEQRIALLLAAVTLLVLLVACANAANLLLAQALQRRRELAVRLALGISRRRLVAHLISESVALGLMSAIAASLVATWLGTALRNLLLPSTEWPIVFDLRIALFTFGISLVIGLLAGAAPALEISRVDVADALKSGQREGGGRSSRVRSALMIAQAALSVVLVIGAGLFMRSLQRVRDVDIGYDVDHVAIAELPTDRALPTAQIADELRAMPAVSAVALTTVAPLNGALGAKLFMATGDSIGVAGKETDYMAVEPTYFDATGIHVLQGRGFSANDGAGAAPVVVVSREFASAVWPGRDPMGQCLRLGGATERCYTVTGIASDVHRFHVLEAPGLLVYVPLLQAPEKLTTTGLVVRTHGDPAPTVRWLQTALGDTAAFARHRSVVTMAERLAPEYGPWQLGAELLTGLGALGLVLAALGLYSVISYLVTRRTRELAVRIAIGAQGVNVIRYVLGNALRLVVIGAAGGMGIAIMAGRFVNGLLYETSPADPAILASAAGILIVTSCVAVLVPVWRALRIDPLIALRED